MAKQELFIPVRMPGLNEFIGATSKSRFSGGAMKKEWTDLTVSYAGVNKLGRFTEPIWVDFHWYEPNLKRDKDNVAFAKKFILDGLQKAGVIKNDNNKGILGFTDHFHYESKLAGVNIIMREIEDGSTNILDGNNK